MQVTICVLTIEIFFSKRKKYHDFVSYNLMFEAMSKTRILCRSVTCVSRFTSPLATQRGMSCTCWTGLPMGCLILCSLGTISFLEVVVRTNNKLNSSKCKVKEVKEKNPNLGRRLESTLCNVAILDTYI